MNEILKELNSAFQIVSTIPVTGDSVDAMAAVRSKLRKVYAEIEKIAVDFDVKPEAPQE